MAVPSRLHLHHHRRSPNGPRPCYRKFKLRPSYLPRREFLSPIRCRELPGPKEELWENLESRRVADLGFPEPVVDMQGGSVNPEAFPGPGVKMSGGGPLTATPSLQEKRPTGKLDAMAGRHYPGLVRPGGRDPPDLREWIRRRIGPSAPLSPPPPPQCPPPQTAPPRDPKPRPSWLGNDLLRSYGFRPSDETCQIPSWADPYGWASAQFRTEPTRSALQNQIRQVPTESPPKEPGNRIRNCTCLYCFPISDRRVWMPGEIRYPDQYAHQAPHLLPPGVVSHIATGPRIVRHGPLFERGRIPMGPSSLRAGATGPGRELEDPGRYCLGQE